MRKWVWPLLGTIGVVLFLLLSPIAEPEAQVDLNVTRQESLQLSRDFLTAQGFDLTGYEGSVSFTSRGDDAVYLQKQFGLEESNRLAREYKVWYWQVRWFEPMTQTEYLVRVDVASPKVLGFSRTYPEAEPGASASQDQAGKIAEAFLSAQGYALSDWSRVDATTQKRPARTDHHFEWQRKGVKVGEAVPKVTVDVQGDKPAGLNAYLLVPDAFQREYQRTSSVGTGLAILSFTLMMGMMVAALIYSIRLSRRGKAAWGLGLWSGALIAGSGALNLINQIPQIKGSLPTTIPSGVFYAFTLLLGLIGAAVNGALVLFPGTAGQGIAAEDGHTGAEFFAGFRRGRILTPGFGAAAFRGLCLAGVMLGYDVLFYYIGRKYLGVWSPAGPRYDDILSTPFPWLYPLSVSLMAGFWEEYLFRLFGVSLAKRLLKWLPAALVLPAMIWAFGHSTYPVFPVWTRGIELTIFGTVLGWVYWKYGVETTVIAHYTYDALLIAWPLLHAGSPYYVLSGAVVSGLALVPAVLGWVASRRGAPAEAPESVAGEGATEGDAPPPTPAPADRPAARDFGAAALNRLVGTLRSRPAVWAALAVASLAVVAGALLLRPVGPEREFKVTDAAAMATARQFLTDQGFDLSGYQVTRAVQPSTGLTYAADVAPDQVTRFIRSYHQIAWTVRFFKPVEPVSYVVDVDMRAGEVIGFRRDLPPDAPGAALTQDAAQKLAVAYLTQRGLDPQGLDLVTSSAQSHEKRLDYVFAWESKESGLPDAPIRREVTIQGDKVGQWQAPHVVVPEAWTRSQEAKTGWYMLLGVAAVIGGLAWLVMALIYVVRGLAPLRPLLVIAPVAMLFGAGTIAVIWPSRTMGYTTTMVWTTFQTIELVQWIMLLVLPALGLAAAWVVAAVVSRRRPAPLPWTRTAVAALALAGLALAASQIVGFVASAAGLSEPELPTVIGDGYLGAFRVLTVPATALGIELVMRVWLQSLLSRWLRSRLAGLVVTAVLMGAALAAMSGGHGWPLVMIGGLLDGLIYGIGYLAGGLPAAALGRTVQLLVSQGLTVIAAGMAPATFSGAVSLTAALLLPLGLYLWGRRQPPTSEESA